MRELVTDVPDADRQVPRRPEWVASAAMTRPRICAAVVLITVALGAGACGGDEGSSSQRDEAPLDEQTPSGEQQGETTPAPAGSQRGSGY